MSGVDALIGGPFGERVDGHQLDAELLDPLDEAVQVRLVAHGAGEDGVARRPRSRRMPSNSSAEAIADLTAEHELVASPSSRAASPRVRRRVITRARFHLGDQPTLAPRATASAREETPSLR